MVLTVEEKKEQRRVYMREYMRQRRAKEKAKKAVATPAVLSVVAKQSKSKTPEEKKEQRRIYMREYMRQRRAKEKAEKAEKAKKAAKPRIPTLTKILKGVINKSPSVEPGNSVVVYQGKISKGPQDFKELAQLVRDLNISSIMKDRGVYVSVEFTLNNGNVKDFFLMDSVIDRMEKYTGNSYYLSLDDDINYSKMFNLNIAITVKLVGRSLSERQNGVVLTHYLNPTYKHVVADYGSYQTVEEIRAPKEVISAFYDIQVIPDDGPANIPCLIYALQKAVGFDDNIYTLIPAVVTPYLGPYGVVLTENITSIADELGICIHIKWRKPCGKLENYIRGSPQNPIVKLAGHNDHYFALKNLRDYVPEGDLREAFKVTKVKGLRFNDTFDLMEHLDYCAYTPRTNEIQKKARSLNYDYVMPTDIQKEWVDRQHYNYYNYCKSQFITYLNLVANIPKQTQRKKLNKKELALTYIVPNVWNDIKPMLEAFELSNAHQCNITARCLLRTRFEVLTKDERTKGSYLDVVEAAYNLWLKFTFQQYGNNLSGSEFIKIRENNKLEEYEPLDVAVLDVETTKGSDDSIQVYSTSVYHPIYAPAKCFIDTNELDSVSEAISYLFQSREYHSTMVNRNYKYDYDKLDIMCHNQTFDISTILNNPKVRGFHKLMGSMSSIKSIAVKWCLWLNHAGEEVCKDLVFRDSMALLPMSLSAAANSLKVECSKGTYPYNFFNLETCEKLKNGTLDPIHTVESFSNNGKYCNMENLRLEAKVLSSYNESEGTFDIKEYIRYYNNLDVTLTYKVVDKFLKLVYDATGVNIGSSLTISGLAMKIAKSYKCLHNIPKSVGLLSEFLRTNLTGGSVHLRDNKVQISDVEGTVVLDFDVNSLYPSSMGNLPGGLPYYIDTKELTRDDLDSIMKVYPSFVAVFRVHNLPTAKSISYVCRKAHKSEYVDPFQQGAIYLQSLKPGEVIHRVGNESYLEILEKYQGLVFGRDYTISSLIGYKFKCSRFRGLMEELYKFRKLSDNPALDTCIKLIMNSTWGKLGQKEYNDYYIADSKQQLELTRLHRPMLSGAIESSNRVKYSWMKMAKRFIPMYSSYSQAAMCVLDSSKLTMARYHYELEQVGFVMRYGDTDSIQCTIEKDKWKEAQLSFRRNYESKYNLDPSGTQFIKPDFGPYQHIGKEIDLLGGIKIDYKLTDKVRNYLGTSKPKDIYGIKSIWLMPKMYTTVIQVDSEKEPAYMVHTKAKGINEVGMRNLLSKASTPFDHLKAFQMYLDIAQGNRHTVEMLDENKVSFRFTLEGGFYRNSLTRTIGLPQV